MQESKRVLHMMGTIIDLYVEDESSKEILDKLTKQLTIYEKRFSANDLKSELMAVNQKAGLEKVQVHPELFQLISVGKKESLEPESLLNIAIGPLVQKWRIGFKDATIPTKKSIASLLPLINPKKIILNPLNSSVFLEDKGMKLDLGSLAKGYIADLVIEYLESIQVKSAMINLGGNIRVLGESQKHPDGLWRIGIQKPGKSRYETIDILKVKNQSVVTSGIYERFILYEGKPYHHILDPKTGYPVDSDVASLTIISDKSLDGEIWTTKLFGKDSKEIIKKVNDLEGVECLVLTLDGSILRSNKLKESMDSLERKN